MLDKLSTEIYTQAVHFTLELIQNADDANYTRLQPHQVPYLAFEAKENLIDVRCNEDGFTSEDVQALCDVDRSTKNATNAIGKKGIGFKSVFKVCDLVQIGSNGFQFSFDKNDRPFGMVKPTWSAFPDWLRDQKKTFIRLGLSEGQVISDIHEDIEDLEPSVLLFLRKIEEISIRTRDFRKTMTCKDRGQQLTTITTKSLFRDEIIDSECLEYVMVKCRPEPTIPEMVLAFPRSSDGHPKLQQVHNFLPVRGYGFKFIIQADFHLTSNREAIEESSERNCALRDMLPDAFLTAVHQFNESEDDCLSWIKYLPGSKTLQGFFASVDIEDYLTNEKILFPQTGELKKPSDLVYVPSEFRFTKSQPMPIMFDGRHTLSTRYDKCDLDALKRLGVKRLNMSLFIRALKELGNEEWARFDCHENLAKVLLKIDTHLLADVPLIPVARRGKTTWMCAKDLKQKPVYFKENLEDDQVPDGINLLFMSNEASRDEHRHRLFEELGVNSLDEPAVCAEIQRVLESPFVQISVDTAVSQTKYLFEHCSDPSSLRIKFRRSVIKGTTETGFLGSWRDAHDLYFDDPRESPYEISRLLGSMSRYHCLHADYLVDDPSLEMDDWMNWLIEQGVNVSPRPITKHQSGTKTSAEFSWFAKHATNTSLCEVVLRRWESYEPYLPVVATVLDQRLNQRIIPTESLHSTALRLDIPASWDQFLDVEIRTSRENYYRRLDRFGLITEANTRFYLEVLRYHRENTVPVPEMPELAHAIYDSLQNCSDVDQTRAAFREEPLIAVETKGAGSQGGRTQWFSTEQCFWSDMDCLCFNTGLSIQFASCERLFRDILKISNVATMKHITTDLALLAGTGDVELIRTRVKPILVRLSTLIRRVQEDRLGRTLDLDLRKKEMVKLKVWPIVAAGGKTSKLVSSRKFTSNNFLFVPDRADLYELLRDKVPLLDFTPSEIMELIPLIEWFPNARLLSKEVQKRLSYSGKQTLLQCLTSDYRQKHEGILRCIRHYLPSSDAEVDGQLHQRLKRIKVYEVEKVDCLQWVEGEAPENDGSGSSDDSVRSVGNAEVSVRTSGDVVLRQDQGKYVIYMTKDESLRMKAENYSIPESLVAGLGLPAEAKGTIALVLKLTPSLSSGILDENGIARLPGAPYRPMHTDCDAASVQTTETPKQETRTSWPLGRASELQAASTSQDSTPSVISRTSNAAAKPFSEGLVIRVRDTPLPVSTSTVSAAHQSCNSPSRTSDDSSEAQAVFQTASRPLPGFSTSSFPSINSGSPSTDQLAESLTGPSDLRKSIMASAEALTLYPEDVVSTQNRNDIIKTTKMSDERLVVYPHSTIGFLGELFVSR
ncbi:MAG: hypothetical protein LQ338_005267 [Usnochroma carphineum]|nr:MAG: hypothetical protein LQ338_005267 [Usnochroma carphineum]